jgi:hypothetical protein
MSRLDWRRCRGRLRETESKYGQGKVLDNGEMTPVARRDQLARRAERTMRAWSRRLSPRDRALLS